MKNPMQNHNQTHVNEHVHMSSLPEFFLSQGLDFDHYDPEVIDRARKSIQYLLNNDLKSAHAQLEEFNGMIETNKIHPEQFIPSLIHGSCKELNINLPMDTPENLLSGISNKLNTQQIFHDDKLANLLNLNKKDFKENLERLMDKNLIHETLRLTSLYVIKIIQKLITCITNPNEIKKFFDNYEVSIKGLIKLITNQLSDLLQNVAPDIVMLALIDVYFLATSVLLCITTPLVCIGGYFYAKKYQLDERSHIKNLLNRFNKIGTKILIFTGYQLINNIESSEDRMHQSHQNVELLKKIYSARLRVWTKAIRFIFNSSKEFIANPKNFLNNYFKKIKKHFNYFNKILSKSSYYENTPIINQATLSKNLYLKQNELNPVMIENHWEEYSPRFSGEQKSILHGSNIKVFINSDTHEIIVAHHGQVDISKQLKLKLGSNNRNPIESVLQIINTLKDKKEVLTLLKSFSAFSKDLISLEETKEFENQDQLQLQHTLQSILEDSKIDTKEYSITFTGYQMGGYIAQKSYYAHSSLSNQFRSYNCNVFDSMCIKNTGDSLNHLKVRNFTMRPHLLNNNHGSENIINIQIPHKFSHARNHAFDLLINRSLDVFDQKLSQNFNVDEKITIKGFLRDLLYLSNQSVFDLTSSINKSVEFKENPLTYQSRQQVLRNDNPAD